MNKIKEILENHSYEDMSINEMEKIAFENFKTLEDDILKESFVEKWLLKQGNDSCGKNDIKKTAKFLVEEGIFMEDMHEV